MDSQLTMIVILMFLCISTCSSQECSSLSSCSQCITRNSTCAWCNDENVFMQYANDVSGQLEPAKLCGTLDELEALSCRNIVNPVGSIVTASSNMVEPPSSVNIGSDEGSGMAGEGDPLSPVVVSTVTPDLISATLRPGVRESISVTVSPPESVSVDMYVLMDLSFTMNDDLSRLREFGAELVGLMQNLTDEFRIGFGSFVDKPVDPFVNRIDRDTPCNREVSSADQCVPTYTFRHHLDFTQNATKFTEELSSATVSGSADTPEALFDALLQVSVCEDVIGWRPVGSARRIVLALTDGDYHTALDGRLAGILRKPTTECRLDPETKNYEYAVEVDYPSSAFISNVLNDNRITPIFAASASVRPLYDGLSTIIRSAFIGQLSDNSENLIDLIREQYRKLSSTVIPLINREGSDEIIVNAVPFDSCGVGKVSDGRPDTCEDIFYPNSVIYNISLEALPSYCERTDAGSAQVVRILYIGFGVVTVNISVHCSCACEANRVEQSSICNGHGDYECSTCVCDDNYVGTTCSCVTGLTSVFGCRGDGSNDTSICNGRGDCLCNECHCDMIPTLVDRRYQGRYCECDPFSCPSGASDSGEILPCSGHGTCSCSAQCVCDGGYTGFSCDCPDRVSSCRREGEEVDCSGMGQCKCGVCVCDNYSERRGQYCEDCVNCRGSCSLLTECVSCLISGNCEDNEMCSNITIIHSLNNISNYNTSNFVFRNCSVVNSNCEVIYQIDQNVVGIEDTILVYIDSTQRSFETWSQSPDDCQPGPNVLIYVIPITIVIVIIIIVIVIIAGWKAITLLAEYSEYKAWERSQQKEHWSTNTNPLFTPATTEHTNPKYRPVHVRQ